MHIVHDDALWDAQMSNTYVDYVSAKCNTAGMALGETGKVY
jgi:hypothetical protein